MNVYPYYPQNGPPRWTDPKADNRIDAALAAATTPGETLQETVRPPLGQIVAFPPRFGLPPYAARQSHIEDVIDVPRITNDRRASWTGTEANFAGSSRPSNEQS